MSHEMFHYIKHIIHYYANVCNDIGVEMNLLGIRKMREMNSKKCICLAVSLQRKAVPAGIGMNETIY